MDKADPGGIQGWWDTQQYGVSPAGHLSTGSPHHYSAAEDMPARACTPHYQIGP